LLSALVISLLWEKRVSVVINNDVGLGRRRTVSMSTGATEPATPLHARTHARTHAVVHVMSN